MNRYSKEPVKPGYMWNPMVTFCHPRASTKFWAIYCVILGNWSGTGQKIMNDDGLKPPAVYTSLARQLADLFASLPQVKAIGISCEPHRSFTIPRNGSLDYKIKRPLNILTPYSRIS